MRDPFTLLRYQTHAEALASSKLILDLFNQALASADKPSMIQCQNALRAGALRARSADVRNTFQSALNRTDQDLPIRAPKMRRRRRRRSRPRPPKN